MFSPSFLGKLGLAAAALSLALGAPRLGAQPQAAAGLNAQAPPAEAQAAPISPLLQPVRQRAAEVRASADGADVYAFYGERTAPPLWGSEEGLTARAQHAMAELARADEWGLSAAAFELPQLGPSDPSAASLAAAEIKLSLAVLAYARFARGGRVNLANFSRSVDRQPSLGEPKALLEAMAATETPGEILKGLHPQHPQFALLRQALLKVRAGAREPLPPDKAPVLLPDGPLLKPAMVHPHVALLRRRLQVAAMARTEEAYDPPLVEAVKAFQRENKMMPDAIVGARARAALNGRGESTPLFGTEAQRLILNMERWRWMPEDLGEFHVWNNVPEFLSR